MNTTAFTPRNWLNGISLASILAMILIAGGCQDIQKRTYGVTVKNDADRPVTVWLTKSGPLYEKNWKSPEDLAIETRSASERIAGCLVKPGETATVGPVPGKFTPSSQAVLRIYLGEHNFSELLAMRDGVPDRRDYELRPEPARNEFRIVNRDGQTLIVRGNEPPMSEPQAKQRHPMSYRQHVSESHSIVARCAIITLSDTRTPETDTSGQLIRKLLEDAGQHVGSYRLILDDPDQLRGAIDELLLDESIDVILTTGGTGISARDTSVDVIEEMLERKLDGFGELFRMLSWEEIGSGAMMSRAIGGVAKGKPIFAMPGSSKAVELAMSKLILPELRHLLHELRKQS